MLGLAKIPSAPGYFAELSTGRIFSAKRGGMKLLRGGNSRGYVIHSLMIEGQQTTRSAHRLVCEAAYGECPEGFECCHLNGNRSDNRAENLRWASQSVNNGEDKRNHGRLKFGESHQNAVLTDRDVSEIRRRRLAGESCKSVGEKFGVSAATISRIARNEAWRHVP